jgi:hypothetical protein
MSPFSMMSGWYRRGPFTSSTYGPGQFGCSWGGMVGISEGSPCNVCSPEAYPEQGFEVRLFILEMILGNLK